MDISIEDLRFLRRGEPVLEIDALHLPAGRTTAVLGPNGAGKTTLLRLISGLERPVAGRVTVGGRPVAAPSRSVAFAFQEPVFVAGTVAENLDLGLRLRGLGAEDRRGRIAEVARELDIRHLLERPARGLSRGEAQRANLARALSLRAPVTLLDEPLAALDAGIRRLLLDELPSLLAGRAATTVLVTHDCEEAIRLADRMVVLVAGRVRAAGTVGEVLRRPPSVGVARILGYLVLRLSDHWIGVPPGALRVGEGPPKIEFEVERVIETATRPEVIGWIAGQRARVAHSTGPPPAPGDRLAIALDEAVPLPEDG